MSEMSDPYCSRIGNLQSSKSPYVPPDMIWNIRSCSIWLKVWIKHNGKQIDAYTILDSGAEGIYNNTNFIKQHLIPTYTIDCPVYPRNIDGTLNKQGGISTITYRVIPTKQRFFWTIQISSILPQSKLWYVIKHGGPSFWELITTLSFLNLVNLIKLMGCPGIQIIKRG